MWCVQKCESIGHDPENVILQRYINLWFRKKRERERERHLDSDTMAICGAAQTVFKRKDEGGIVLF